MNAILRAAQNVVYFIIRLILKLFALVFRGIAVMSSYALSVEIVLGVLGLIFWYFSFDTLRIVTQQHPELVVAMSSWVKSSGLSSDQIIDIMATILSIVMLRFVAACLLTLLVALISSIFASLFEDWTKTPKIEKPLSLDPSRLILDPVELPNLDSLDLDK